MNTYEPVSASQRLKSLAGATRQLLAYLLQPAGWRPGRHQNGRNDGPPDLDELWRDFNRKLTGMFGSKSDGNGPAGKEPSGGKDFQPDLKSAGIGAGLIGGVVLLGWLGSGFFIVQEGQQSVIKSTCNKLDVS